ncbi:MAG: DapH/DapD/GlmU-related protein, partial [Culicoidibacterales bacterium]
GDETHVMQSVMSNSSVGAKSTVGPFAHLRQETACGDHVRIGNFVEMKKTSFANNAKASHLSYLGDSEVCENVNIGCGVVTVNYDGHNKNKTTIEANAFIGCNANLIAPVTIGEGVYVAAGSTVTKDVPADALAIARARQENKAGYAKQLRERFVAKK